MAMWYEYMDDWMKGGSNRQNGYIAESVPLNIFNPLAKVTN